MRLFLAVCLLWTMNSFAQDSTRTDSIHRFAITFRPLGVVSPFLTNFTFGLQFKLTKKIVIEADGGWIQSWYFISAAGADNISSSGYKVSGEVKYVIYKGMYFALQGFYNDYIRKSEEYVWRFGQTYEEKMDIERFIISWGGHLKGGIILTKPNNKFFLDVYGGLGARQKKIRIPDLPDGAEIIDNGHWDLPPGTFTFPSMTLGVAVGYAF
jgi:hypothetical protein